MKKETITHILRTSAVKTQAQILAFVLVLWIVASQLASSASSSFRMLVSYKPRVDTRIEYSRKEQPEGYLSVVNIPSLDLARGARKDFQPTSWSGPDSELGSASIPLLKNNPREPGELLTRETARLQVLYPKLSDIVKSPEHFLVILLKKDKSFVCIVQPNKTRPKLQPIKFYQAPALPSWTSTGSADRSQTLAEEEFDNTLERGKFLAGENQFEQALNEYLTASSLVRGNSDVEFLTFRVTKALSKHPRCVAGHLALANLSAYLGNWAGTELECKQVLDLRPTDEQRKAALSLLKRLRGQSKPKRIQPIQEGMSASWNPGEHPGFLLARCWVHVTSTRGLTAAKLMVSSGDPAYDESSLEAVRRYPYTRLHGGLFDFGFASSPGYKKVSCTNWGNVSGLEGSPPSGLMTIMENRSR
ncbi:MAG: hypothetical protein KC777_29060 [Cyanobacteria bacterium HKST-UBA02]|nr:hypothetical protein [Cyanobacteria bacterium HKST-UBA02]